MHVDVDRNYGGIVTHRYSQRTEPTLFVRPPVLRFTVTPPPLGFVGRRAELADLLSHYEQGVLITSAAGDLGEGATALARQLAATLAEQFPDGCLEIDLCGGMPDLMTPLSIDEAQRRLLQLFYPDVLLPEEAGALDRLYRDTFIENKVLLLLDNAAGAAQVQRLIPPQPSAVIVTARTAFSIPAALYTLSLQKMRMEDARALLLQLAPECARWPRRIVGELLQRFGDSPLALRLLGALLRDTYPRTPRTLLTRYDVTKKRLLALRMDDCNLTVSIALELAYEAMPTEQRHFFEALAVFPAPFTRLAAMAVWDVDAETADALLVSFVRSNLVMYTPATELYTLHDMVSLYVQTLLLGQPERTHLVLERYAQHVLVEVARASDLYGAGETHREEAMWRFNATLPHFRVAWLRMSGMGPGWPQPGNADRWLCDVVLRVFPLLNRVLPVAEQMGILERVLESARLLDRQAEAKALLYMGEIYTAQAAHEQALRCYETYCTIMRELQNRKAEAEALMRIGSVYGALGNVKRAQESWQYATVLFRTSGDSRAAQLRVWLESLERKLTR